MTTSVSFLSSQNLSANPDPALNLLSTYFSHVWFTGYIRLV